ncbi:cupin domain-containing protein [Rhodoferax sp. WC2427]|uniref:AraC family transcriptional regulator n=1 Tax=Rhodoferax sp. WC2427 TaxID=3234144 RepID=UPI003467DCEE
MDVLSDVLHTIRMQGAIFLNAECHEPWCVDVPQTSELARFLKPGARSLAICHTVLEGSCWVQLPGGEAVALHAGDVATMPHGDPHLIGSGLHHAPVSIDHVVKIKEPHLTPIRYGGEGDRTVLMCGWFAYEQDIPNPLVASLPKLFCSAVGKRPSGPWIEQSLRYAVGEAAIGQPGSGAMAAKVAESLFVETLRGYIESLPPRHLGWLAGLRDPQVGKCLSLIHTHPAKDWSVESLAGEVHVSRSVLAQRFNELVGMPPIQYLIRWRLAVAARLLRSERISLGRVTEAIGYESEASFSRAFKKEFGVAPGQWRNGKAAALSG